MKIATSITETDINLAIDNALKIMDKYPDIIIELRADYLDKIDEADLSLFRKKLTSKLIFTLREPSEGGKRQYDFDEKIKILLLAQELGFDLIDCEFKIFEKLQISKQSEFDKTKLILSYHDFKKTPLYKTIKNLYKNIKYYYPAIIKLAFAVNSSRDVKKVCKLIISTNDKKVIIGMGEQGKMTRLLGPILGCEFTFAANEFYTSAPGQVKIDILDKIYKEINKLI
ncbi:MAG: type I 3-dehydroquinate dehydratase [Candidatus Dojkabacteria bacterium]|nr:type I 3-dehydroquinate dehydratase [Candidatus Dojkabacteria bacterium]